MTVPLLTLSQYAALVGVSAQQRAMLLGLGLTTTRTTSDWSAFVAPLLANPLTRWQIDASGLDAVASGAGGLTGTNAKRRAYDTSTLGQKTQWNVTDGGQTYWFTPNDTAWRDSDGNDPDYVNPNPPPPDSGAGP